MFRVTRTVLAITGNHASPRCEESPGHRPRRCFAWAVCTLPIAGFTRRRTSPLLSLSGSHIRMLTRNQLVKKKKGVISCGAARYDRWVHCVKLSGTLHSEKEIRRKISGNGRIFLHLSSFSRSKTCFWKHVPRSSFRFVLNKLCGAN